MIQRDVLMRQVQQLAQALASILQRSRQGTPQDVLDALQEAYDAHLDSSTEEVETTAPDRLVALCSDDDRFSANAAQTLARLLTLQGDAHRDRDQPARAGACYGRALLLMRHVLNEPDATVSWQLGTQVAALEERIADAPLSDELKDALGRSG